MADYIRIMSPDDDSESYDLYMDTDVPGADGIMAAGRTPNGYLWEGLLEYLVGVKAPGLRDLYEPDSEADTFVVSADTKRVARQLRDLIAPFVEDPQLARSIIIEAESAGFEFDD